MLKELEILNGEMSLVFDPLNSKYTVFVADNVNELEIEYKLKENANIVIEGNYNLTDGSEVVITVSDGMDSVIYLFNVYKNKDEKVSENISNITLLDVNSKKEVSEYAGPGIASTCFVLILFLFVLLFHKKRS